jgi:hypothetical protein
MGCIHTENCNKKFAVYAKKIEKYKDWRLLGKGKKSPNPKAFKCRCEWK